MKRTILVAAAALTLATMGCSKDEPTPKPTPSASPSSSSSASSSPTVSPSAVPPSRSPRPPSSPPPAPAVAGGGEDSNNHPAPPVYYANCAAVRSAGKAPLHRGQPGYRSALDRDGDGVACDK